MILSKSSGKILPGQTRTSAQFCKADCECENEETAVRIGNIRQTDFQKGNEMAEYKLITTEGRAKRGEFKTVHGTIQTPVFMNVGTIAAIKGAVSTVDLHEIGTQVQLSNTYHLHVRPGDKIVKQLGGLHQL